MAELMAADIAAGEESVLEEETAVPGAELIGMTGRFARGVVALLTGLKL
jgi:hypothetical protein